ncbi:MAG: hypothetical protein FJ292_02060 [Planctomycetes bacterium]|nr:hypothetical protein [Planctomycetota bacterium]
MTRSMSCLSALTFSCTLTVGATAGLVSTQTIGSGAKSASLQFDFENGNTHVVNVRWDGTLTGFGALELMSTQATGGRLDYQSFSFGKFVTGLGVGGDYQYGEGELWPVENYWHYWTAEGDAAFEAPMFGASGRAMQDGSRDAWVFGSSAAPAVIPAPGVLALAACVGMCRRRRA